ncbi:MAG: hypothetical protein AAGN66_18865 [Acidobacteriota bacterium]
MRPSLPCVFWILPVFCVLVATPSLATCPPDPPPPDCGIDDQFPGGRWDLSQITGSYTLSGDEVFWPFLDDDELWDDYSVDGSLSVQMDGGPSENYLDVECDGTVTGQGKERITGTLSKTADIWYYDEEFCINDPADMEWTVTIERTYSISGNVAGAGQLDLDLSVDEATIDMNGSLAASFDCIFISGSGNLSSFDLSGDTEQVRLSGTVDETAWTWDPTVTPRGAKTWVDDVLHRLALNQTHQYMDNTLSLAPSLDGAAGGQPAKQEHNHYFIQDAVTVTANLSAMAEPKTPVVTSLELEEPSQYLQDVAVDTTVMADIDWRGQSPGQVEFTYGGTTETVAGADTVTWTFDAGESGTTIEAKAIAGSEESEPYTINTPKVTVPGWAGSPGDWSGSGGVRYEGNLNWPVSLETTQTLETIDLFSGLWGISGGASSEFMAVANSSGGAGAGDMSTEADIQFAGNSASFRMEGPNSTTLACDELTTTGSATAQVDGPTWQKTLNPVTLVPGIEASACALNGMLCSAVRSVGVKASASVTLTGSATYTGEGGEIRWDGGSLGGSITGQISAGATLPPPIASVAGVNVYGSATGCIEFQVSPSFELSTLGGELEAGASAHFMGLSAEASETWPFGAGCGGGEAGPLSNGPLSNGPISTGPTSTLWVPADGQLAMAATSENGDLLGIAVWSELPAGQSRPSGDIHYRFYRGGTWGEIRGLTADGDSDVAPTVGFDANGDAVVVYARSTAPLPSTVVDLPAFGNGYELHWARISAATEAPLAQGILTANGLHDFGPRLRRDASDGLHLFWQRADGVDIAGTSAAPASIHVSTWDAAAGSWGPEETVADALEDTFGWSAAAFDGGTMLVGLVVDTDGDFATAEDRELFEVSRQGGTWAGPRQVTVDAVADDSVQAGYDGTGAPVLLWRRGMDVLELRGDLLAAPVTAFTTADPTTDAGVGVEFAHGAMATGEAAGDLVLWPEASTLLLTQRGGDGGPGWATPELWLPTGGAQSVHGVRVEGNELWVAYAVRPFEGDGVTLSPWLEPRFHRGPRAERIFADDFESGNTTAWTKEVQ